MSWLVDSVACPGCVQCFPAAKIRGYFDIAMTWITD